MPPRGRLLRPAALALVEDGEGRFLTVARDDPPYEQAFPGGEVDPEDRNPAAAALRELYEETGVFGAHPILVWIGQSPTDGRTVYVFAVMRWTGVPYAREGNRVAFLKPRQIVAQGRRYAAFAADLFRALVESSDRV